MQPLDPFEPSPADSGTRVFAMPGASPRVADQPTPENARKCPISPDEHAFRENEPISEHARKRPVLPDPNAFRENEPNSGAAPKTRPLTPRQLTAVDLLFRGATFNRVCGQLGIDAKTLFRWRNSKPFQEEVTRRYREKKEVSRRPPSRKESLIAGSDPPPKFVSPQVTWEQAEAATKPIQRMPGESDLSYGMRWRKAVGDTWMRMRGKRPL